MTTDNDFSTDRRQKQARNLVLIALIVGLLGTVLGIVFGISAGTLVGPDFWLIGLLGIVTGVLTLLLILKPALATSVIAGSLTIYFAIHLNAGAIVLYRATGEIVRLIPYVIWLFPLVIFHHFTNFGFYKRAITILVGLSPLPVAGVVLMDLPQPLSVATADAVVTFLFSFYIFVICFGLYARHRDAEVQRVAMAEEAQRSAEALRVSEERFRLLSRATDDLIWDADLTSGKVWWSESLLETLGYSTKDARSGLYAWRRWIHPDDRHRVVSKLIKAIKKGTNWTSEFRLLCSDGEVLDVVSKGVVLRDSVGKPVRLIGSTTDVTELRVLENKLRQSQKMEAVGQLTGGIAHDFNNLLTIIMGSSESLADMFPDNPNALELASHAMLAAQRGADLTARLLSFARLQALAPEYINPGQLLKDINGLINRTISEDIEIVVSVADNVQPIEVDRSQLENAILNLVINARDAMPYGGQLTIEASNITLAADDLPYYDGMQAGDYVVIAVSDNGIGMSPETMERAFEPFFTSKEAGEGSGLGLSMVWGFVRQSKGQALIYSEVGEGTSVKLYFPAAKTAQARATTPTTNDRLTGGTERILVVEDDKLLREQVAVQLADLGYQVRQAASADEALMLMNDGQTVDLLFTDVVMPGGMNGKQLADAAKSLQPGLRVLFTSGYAEDAIVHQGRLDPGVDLLGKPYRRAELMSKIREVLDREPD